MKLEAENKFHRCEPTYIYYSDDLWEKRRDKIMAEHRLPHAREQLAKQWKEWIALDSFKERRAAATRVQAATDLPEFDE